MQAAAQAAAGAATAARNLGINPRYPTQGMPDVTDGLNVPNSSGPGLSVAYTNGAPTLWVGAAAPIQKTSSGSNNPTQVTVTVDQQQQQAYLQWQTFDVGKSTSLVFDQSAGGSSAGNWIAFNYIRDPSGRPSQILGSISSVGPANSQGASTTGGQVYVINANGIIFGGSSQVNTGALVASSLPINTNLVQRGLLNNPDEQFLFSALALAPGTNGPTPGFDPTAATAGIAPAQTPYDPAGTGASGSKYPYGDVTVQAGAQLTAPSSNFVGGKVALVGANVTNAGIIATPDGQAILAAGLQVGWAAHSSSDATLRGLDVYVGQVADSSLPNQPPSGIATNADTGTLLSTGQPSPTAGLIDAPRGDVTLAGAAVNQLGVIDSTTSVSYNGQVDLLAAYNSLSGRGFSVAPFFPQATGPVALGADSLTQILPQVGDSATVAATSLALPSTVVIQGGNVTFAGSSDAGALLFAPNGAVTVDAGSWRFTSGGIIAGGVVSSNSLAAFTFDGGTITLADNAGIDVSGSENVSASVQENIVAVQLLGPQLAGSPLQRNGPLRGQTIYVNVLDTGTYNGQPWVGTPLADTSGYVGLIPHSVGELTVNGGTVSLQAGTAVHLNSGSTIDVAGGWSNYAGGTVQTSKLLYQGKLVDISQATPDHVYDGIYTGTSTVADAKWGVTSTVSSPLPLGTLLSSYVQGGNGGSVAITAGSITTNGSLFGQTYAGQNQRQPFVPYTSSTPQTVASAGIDPRVWELNSVPAPSSLSLTFQQQYLVGPGLYASFSPSPPDIYFLPATALPPNDPNALILSPSLTDPDATTYGGFGNLTIDDSAGNEKINAQSQLVVPPVPSTQTITIPAGVTLETAPGGSVSLSAANLQVQGGIVAPGGKVSLTSSDFWSNSPYLTGSGASTYGIPAYNPLRGNLTVGPQGTVSTDGLIVDNRSSAGQTEPLITAGGSAALSGSNVTLAAGAVVSANGGASIGATGRVTYGGGGAVALEAGGEAASGITILGGSLSFDVAGQINSAPAFAPLQAYSGSSGGKLTLESSLIQVGTSPGVTPPAGALVLPSAMAAGGGSQGFFNAGGFSGFTLIGLGDVLDPTSADAPLMNSQGKVVTGTAVAIASGTATAPTLIHPRVKQLQVIPGASGSWQTQILVPFTYQNTPASLTFSAPGVINQTNQLVGFNALVARGDIVVGAGATVQTDPQTSSGGGVSLTGQTVTVLGNVIAPGGTISIKGGPDSTTLFPGQVRGLITVDLGPDSQLSTAGLTLLTPDNAGRVPGEAGYVNTGAVVGGGSVTLSGNIVTESNPSNPNSVINVSGWSDANDHWGLLEMAPQYSGVATNPVLLQTQMQTLIPTVEAKNGGTITLKAAQALFPDKKMIGAAGGAGAAGGTLTVSGQTFGTLPGSGDFFDTLQVTAAGPTIPGSFYSAGQTAIGRAVLGSGGTPLSGLNLANFAASSFSAGRFDSLNLYGAVFFQGTSPINLAAKGELTIGGDASAYSGAGFVSSNVAVSLNAAEVFLGQSYLPPVPLADEPLIFTDGQTFPATGGVGSLTVSAGSNANPGLINIGNLTLQNISVTNLTSVAGDVQGYGTVDIAGNLTIAADAVYPSTAKRFTIDAYSTTPQNGVVQPGTVMFEASSATPARPVPLSAGGTLSVYASVINQNGVLYAPLGTVNLGWDGAGTAPATDRITGLPVPSTQTLALGAGSLTSVSGNSAGYVSGAGLPIPYGINLNGTSWIDPTGVDITSGGPPAKAVNLQGVGVTIANNATIDASGGGNLYAYQFVPGTGGEGDILTAASGSFAVLPGYAASYAPFAAFNGNRSNTNAINLLYPDLGYSSNALSVGEQVRIDLGNGSGAQTYTLLPARYALLPGAFLITPMAGSPVPSALPTVQPDGSYVTVGYLFNGFDPTQPLYSNFAVATGTAASGAAGAPSSANTVVRTRAQYADYLATTFFNSAKPGTSGSTNVPAIPGPDDGGQLAITATGSLSLHGSIDARAAGGGQGGGVDISGSNSEAIVINDTGVAPSSGATSNTLFLSAGELSNFGAGSLLVGGTLAGSKVTITAPSLEVANDSGAALQGSDIILAANGSLTVDPGAVIQATTAAGSAANLQITDTVQLAPASSMAAAGAPSKLTLGKGGTSVTFVQTVPKGETLTASAAGTLVDVGGGITTFAAGATFTSASTALAQGSSLSFTASGGGTLTLTGTGAALPVTLGDGTLLRVSGSATATTTRIPIASPAVPTVPTLEIGAKAVLSGASVVVDSTNVARIDSTAILSGGISLRSGQISLVLDPSLAGPAASASPTSLILSGPALKGLQANATSLSLVSYSSIDTYGSGTIGGPSDTAIELHTGEIRGFDQGTGGQALGATTADTSVTFEAKAITLDNGPGAKGPGPISAGGGAGAVTFDATAGAISLGANTLGIDQFANVALTATGGVLVLGSSATPGALAVSGNLTLSAPIVTGAVGAVGTLSATQGSLTIAPLAGGTATVKSGLGASLTLQGSSVDVTGDISLPSGNITVSANGATASTGGVSIGGTLDVAGKAQAFNADTAYTDGGQIALNSSNGSVALLPGGYLSVAAPSGGGNAGAISVSAPSGAFSIASVSTSQNGVSVPSLDGSAPKGQAGTFSLDVMNLSDASGNITASLGPLETILGAGDFALSQSIRVRTGNVIVDGAVKARTLLLSADDPAAKSGNIEVTPSGEIDASGPAGGTVELDASGGVTLDSGSAISVRGVNFNDAGRGGSVTLHAGSYVGSGAKAPSDLRNPTTGLFAGGAMVDISAGSTVDLSVANDHALQLNPGGASASTPPGSITVPSGVAVYFPGGTPGNDSVTITQDGVATLADGTVRTFKAGSALQLPSQSTLTLSNSGSITFAGGSGGSIPVDVPSQLAGGGVLNLSPVNATDLTAFNATGTLTLEARQVFDPFKTNPFDRTAFMPVDVRIDPIAGKVLGASSIAAVGIDVFDLTPSKAQLGSPAAAATIDATVQGLIQQNQALFAGGYSLNLNGYTLKVAGHTAAITAVLAGGNTALSGLLHVRPGAEIVNALGDLDMNTTWDFAQTAVYSPKPGVTKTVMLDRFGANDLEAGNLFLRARGDIVLGQGVDPVTGNVTFGSLNDGFSGFDGSDNSTLVAAQMLPAGLQSWSYRLTAGADLSAADSTRVLSQTTLAADRGGIGMGSILLGQGSADLAAFDTNFTSDFYQTIRTGTGGIGLYAGLNIELLDNLFSIYTAGTQAAPFASFLASPTSNAQFSSNGGDVALAAQGSIEHRNAEGQPDSSKELPLNWLDRQGSFNSLAGQFVSGNSTAWWVDFTNFFEGVGALGGGNVTLTAGGNIANVDAVIPTNERATSQIGAGTGGIAVDRLAADQPTLELGGGDLEVRSGRSTSGGVYYVERGQGLITAGTSITTNGTRAALSANLASAVPALLGSPQSWLPTTLFLGDGNFTVQGTDGVLIGAVANPFLLPAPAGSNSYFSTYAAEDAIRVASLTGSVTLKDSPDSDQGTGSASGSLLDWLGEISATGGTERTLGSTTQPWLALNVPQISAFGTLVGIMPPTLRATAYSRDINLVGGFTLSPSADGQLALKAAGSVNGFQPNSAAASISTAPAQWGSAVINLSDANPAAIPSVADPLSQATSTAFSNVNSLFAESGSITGAYAVLQTQLALHSPGLLHAGDPNPVVIDAAGGNISGLTLYSAKHAQVSAGADITDVSLYVQNDAPGDITSVVAGGGIIPYDPSSPLRGEVTASKQLFLNGGSQAAAPGSGNPNSGDIQIAGPGTLEVLAGGNINLVQSVGAAPSNGTSTGITSIGNSANPYLPFQGANIVMTAGIPGIGGLGNAAPGLANSSIDFTDFISGFIDPLTAPSDSKRYLPELANMLGVSEPAGATPEVIWASLESLPTSSPAELRDQLAFDAFFLVLRDAGRDRNNPASPNFGAYKDGYSAITTLFPGSPTVSTSNSGNPSVDSITMATRLVESTNGGDIAMLSPRGYVTVGRASDAQTVSQGILTESGGNISIFAQNDIGVGTSRIFTLKGGNEIIWSTLGNIAAGSGSKTVHSAPPSRVLINPQSATVENDLAGLSTGSGIGVLATLVGVAPGDVDLIAPAGTIDAGDAGIRASGNVSVSALHIVNGSNIQASGATTGVPTVAAPNIGGLTAAASSTAASSGAATSVSSQQQNEAQAQGNVIPSIINVEVLGYGGGDDEVAGLPSAIDAPTG